MIPLMVHDECYKLPTSDRSWLSDVVVRKQYIAKQYCEKICLLNNVFFCLNKYIVNKLNIKNSLLSVYILQVCQNSCLQTRTVGSLMSEGGTTDYPRK